MGPPTRGMYVRPDPQMGVTMGKRLGRALGRVFVDVDGDNKPSTRMPTAPATGCRGRVRPLPEQGNWTPHARARARCLRNGRIAFFDFASSCDQQPAGHKSHGFGILPGRKAAKNYNAGRWARGYLFPRGESGNMASNMGPSEGVGQPESGALADTAEILAGLCQRVADLERRLVKKRPDTNARRMTRLDRCPFGWRPHPKNPAVLIEDPMEQRTIFRLTELAQDPKASYREICRRLDLVGCKRRGGKKWAGRTGWCARSCDGRVS